MDDIIELRSAQALRSDLFEAAKLGEGIDDRADRVHRLLDEGADPDAKDELGRSALHYAAMMGAAKSCGELVTYCADIRAKDSDGVEPLAFAILSCATPTAKLLLELGADPDCCDVWGQPMVHLAICGGSQREELLGDLGKAGADLGKMDRHGLTPIHWAAVMGKTEAARQLVQMGADPNALDQHGRHAWQTCGYDDEILRESFKSLAAYANARPAAAARSRESTLSTI